MTKIVNTMKAIKAALCIFILTFVAITGHDHDNDFYGEYEGILLAYGRKTGYGGYGPPKGKRKK
jgi:hypothetical protein